MLEIDFQKTINKENFFRAQSNRLALQLPQKLGKIVNLNHSLSEKPVKSSFRLLLDWVQRLVKCIGPTNVVVNALKPQLKLLTFNSENTQRIFTQVDKVKRKKAAEIVNDHLQQLRLQQIANSNVTRLNLQWLLYTFEMRCKIAA